MQKAEELEPRLFVFRDRLPEAAGRIQDDVRRALLLARAPSAVAR